MTSTIWTADEARYLKAALRWQEGNSDDEKVQARPQRAPRRQAIGEFRVLLVGAKGAGKTSIMTRFCQGTFMGDERRPDPMFARGGRHTIDIEGQTYIIDALEMPAKQIASNQMLERALSITEAAVIVYDVRAPDSLKLARGIADFIRDTVRAREYGMMLVGNKSDIDDEDRQVSWSEGSRAAASFKMPSSGCHFIEVSAKSGDNIDKVFPLLGREVLKLRWLNQQRREQAERMARMSIESPSIALKRRAGIWQTLTTPFFRRGSSALSQNA